jgi:hypothetical protein
MKSLLLSTLLLLSLSSIPAQADGFQGDDAPTLDSTATALAKDEIQVIYEKFLKEDLLKSPYCNEGYGDRPASKFKMKLACRMLKQSLLAELKMSPRKWKRKFYLERKEQALGMIAGQFIRAPKMVAFAPLSCTLILNAGWSIKHLWLVDAFFELYCDH